MKHSKDTILANDDDSPATEAEKSLIRFLDGQPSRFEARTPYGQVPVILQELIRAGWLQSQIVLRTLPGRTVTEFALRDGWKVVLDIPPEFTGEQDRKTTIVEFRAPEDPSHPIAVKTAHFHHSPARSAIYVTA